MAFFSSSILHQKNTNINNENNDPLTTESVIALNLIYSIDKNYLFGALISLITIIKNNPNKKIITHIFTDYLDNYYQQKIEEIMALYQIKIHIYLINKNNINFLPSIGNWSKSIFYRIIALDFLSDQLTQALYLDADVVCRGDIDALCNIDLQNHHAAVIKDTYTTRKRASETYQIADFCDNYFNSGVMLINLAQWKSNQLTEKFMTSLTEARPFELLFPDQDILNFILAGKVMFLPEKFNASYSLIDEFPENKLANRYQQLIKNDICLIHYAGSLKPWNNLCSELPSNRDFMDAYKTSPLNTHSLSHEIPFYLYKKKASCFIKQGKIFSAILAYMNYKKEKTKASH